MSEHIRIILLNTDGNNGKCELCGKEDELRPYGPNGEKICFDCGMKDEETTKRQFQKILKGEDRP